MTDWWKSKNELGGECLQFPAVISPFWQNLTLSIYKSEFCICRFGFLIFQASVTISRCGEDMHRVDSCMFCCMEAGRQQIPSFQCLCTLCPKNVLHFLSCTLQWLSVPAFYFPSAHGKLSCFPHEAHANAGTPKAFSALQREHCFPVRLQTAS